MLKIKNENGEDKQVIPLNKGISDIPLPKPKDIDNVADKIKIIIEVDGLPVGSNDLDALNNAIKDFTKAGKIDPLKISNGANTFEELYKIIDEKNTLIFGLNQLVKNYEQTR